MPTARISPAAAVVGGEVYVIGGFTTEPDFAALDTVEAYTPPP
jgi:hypothetical protein